MFVKLGKIIKRYDNFGYKFSFKFNRKDDEYQTIVGGVASIIMYLIIMLMFLWEL